MAWRPIPMTPAAWVTTISTGSIACSRIYAQAAQILTFVLAARVLGPIDFGTFALVQAVALGMILFSSAGWRETAIVRPSLSPFAFAFAIGSGLLSALLLGIVAIGMLTLAGDPDVILLIMCFAISVPMSSTAIFLEGLALRNERVQFYAMGAIIAETVGVIVTLVGLAMGLGLAALGLARIGMAVLYLLGGIYAAQPSRPRIGRRRTTWRHIFVFSRGIMLARAWDYFNNNTATLVAGFLLGPAAAGIYRAASRLVAAAFEAITEAARVITWRGIITRNERINDIEASVLLWKIWTIAFPVCFGLALTGPDLVRIALGAEWAAAGLVVSLLAFRRLGLSSYIVLEPILASHNKTARAGTVSKYMASISLVFILFCAPFGLLGLTTGQVAAGIIGGGLILYELHRTTALSLPLIFAAAWRPLVASIIMCIGILLGEQAWGTAANGLVLSLLVGFSTYIIMTIILTHKNWK